jgi:hypothetical protein
MKDLIVLLMHLLATLTKLLGPGGAKAKDIVRRILARYYHPAPDTGGGPSWLTFIGHMKGSLWSEPFAVSLSTIFYYGMLLTWRESL